MTFLTQAYKFKQLGDYGVGVEAIVHDDAAADLIAGATSFLEQVTAMLAD